MSAMMRERVLMALVNLGHSRTIDEAMKRFQAYLDDRNTPLLPVDCRRVTIKPIIGRSLYCLETSSPDTHCYLFHRLRSLL